MNVDRVDIDDEIRMSRDLENSTVHLGKRFSKLH